MSRLLPTVSRRDRVPCQSQHLHGRRGGGRGQFYVISHAFRLVRDLAGGVQRWRISQSGGKEGSPMVSVRKGSRQARRGSTVLGDPCAFRGRATDKAGQETPRRVWGSGDLGSCRDVGPRGPDSPRASASDGRQGAPAPDTEGYTWPAGVLRECAPETAMQTAPSLRATPKPARSQSARQRLRTLLSVMC